MTHASVPDQGRAATPSHRGPSSPSSPHLSPTESNLTQPETATRLQAELPPDGSVQLATAKQDGPANTERKLIGMSDLAAFISKASNDVRTEYIEFAPGDPENPFNWPKLRRWAHCMLAMCYTGMTAINATAYSAAEEGVIAQFGTTHEIFTLGNAMYFVFIAFTPLALAPLSEVYGRNRILIASALIYAIFYIPQALAPNVTTLIVARGIQGAVASVGNSLVGGIVSDMFEAEERGPVMAFYGFVNFFGQGIGPAPSAYLAAAKGWPWVFWWQLIVTGVVNIAMILFIRESRGSVLLTRRAAYMTTQSFASERPDEYMVVDGKRKIAQPTVYKCRAAEERASLAVMAKTSLTRPIVYLVTEPVIFWMALWAAFAWGMIFLLVDVVPLVFSVYGWTQQQKSLIFLSYALCGALGLIATFHQEHLYARSARRHGGKAPPEARLYWPCVSAVVFPAGFFILGWGARASVHPAVPIFGICVVSFGVYPLYVCVFSYLADVYERYASSALAAQSMLRNLSAGLIPLIATQLYNALGTPWASTLVGCIAFLLGLCPFVLFRYGERIRGRSRVAKAMRREEEAQASRLEDEKLVLEGKLERAAVRRKAATAVAPSGLGAGDGGEQVGRKESVGTDRTFKDSFTDSIA